jgi:hypothetical protein
MVIQLVKIFLSFMRPEGSLVYPQRQLMDLILSQCNSVHTLKPCFLQIHLVITMVSSCIGLKNWCHLFRFSNKHLYKFFILLMLSPFAAHFIITYFVILVLFDKYDDVWRSLLCLFQPSCCCVLSHRSKCSPQHPFSCKRNLCSAVMMKHY